MSRTLALVALVLGAATVAATIAQASPTGSVPPKVDPLAVGFLRGKGLSPSEIRSWTVGACSRATKPASCYAILDRTSAPSTPVVDPLAVGFLRGKGLSPSEIRSWTVGACSRAT